MNGCFAPEPVVRSRTTPRTPESGLSAIVSMVLSDNQVMARPVVTPRPPMLRAIRTRSFSLTTFGAWSAMINSTSSAAALAETVGLCWSHWYLAAPPRQWFEPKIYRLSPDGARRPYRGVAKVSPRIPCSRADSAGCAPGRFRRPILRRAGAATNLRVTKRATQSGSVGLTGITKSRSPCRKYVDRFKTSDEGLRQRSSDAGSKRPCASAHRRDCYH